MTHQEKQHKLKLIKLIMLVETERFKKSKFNSPFGIIAWAYDFMWWAMEYRKVSNIATFEKGGLAISVECNADNEVIIDKSGNIFKLN